MGHAAKITTIDAPRMLSRVLHQFHQEATTALEELSQEVQRAVQWIQHDCKSYWGEQIRLSQQAVAEARVNLERRQMMTVADHRPSCYDEKKALELAKQHLAMAEERLEAIRHWSYALSHAVHEYKGGVGGFVHWLESDLPRGFAALEQITAALESYVTLATPVAEAADGELSSARRSSDHEDVRPVDGVLPAGDGPGDAATGPESGGGALEGSGPPPV